MDGRFIQGLWSWMDMCSNPNPATYGYVIFGMNLTLKPPL